MQTARTLAPPAPKEEGTEPPAHTTTPEEETRIKSTAAMDGTGPERKQPSTKAATAKLGGSRRSGWVQDQYLFGGPAPQSGGKTLCGGS